VEEHKPTTPAIRDSRDLVTYEIIPRHDVIHQLSDTELDVFRKSRDSNDLALFTFSAGLGIGFLVPLLVGSLSSLMTVLFACLVVVCALFSLKFLVDHRSKQGSADDLADRLRRKAG
jgi:hypothetical protein